MRGPVQRLAVRRRSCGGRAAIARSITTGVDNALTGMGGQRAVQILDDPYGDGTPGNYLNRAAFTTPATGTYSDLEPFTIVNPSRLTNDLAIIADVQVRRRTDASSSAGRSST